MDPEITDEAVASTWAKALRTLRVSRRESLQGDPAFILAYQAALQSTLAVLRAAGHRVMGRNQLQDPFSRVTAMDAGELSSAARAVDGMSKLHREVFFGPVTVDSEQLARMHALAGRLFAAAYPWLREARPGLALTPPPD